MRPKFTAWLAGTLPLLVEIQTSINDFTRRMTADETRFGAAADVAVASRAEGFAVDDVTSDAQQSWRAAMHTLVSRTYDRSVFVSASFLERCSSVNDLRHEIATALGDDALEQFTVHVTLAQPSQPSLPFMNRPAFRLGHDRVGILLHAETANGFTVDGLLQFAVRFTGRTAELLPSRGAQVAASDLAIMTAVAQQLDAQLSVPTRRSFALPNLEVFGGTPLSPTTVLARERGLTIVSTGSTLGQTRIIPDASAETGSFDTSFVVDAARVRNTLQDRVAAVGRSLGADFRLASASLQSVRFSPADQAIFASAGIFITQQGGENPCEWELAFAQGVDLQLTPRHRGPAAVVIITNLIGRSQISSEFRFRQDLSPCKLLALEFVQGIIGAMAGRFAEANFSLGNQALPVIEIAPPNVSFLDVIVRADDLLVLVTLANC